MGGGKKKLSFAQIEKSQEKKPEKKKETKSSGSSAERKIPDIIMPDATSGKIVDEVKNSECSHPTWWLHVLMYVSASQRIF